MSIALRPWPEAGRSYVHNTVFDFQLTVAYLRGFGAHRRAKIGPQRSAEMRGARTNVRTGPQGGTFRG